MTSRFITRAEFGRISNKSGSEVTKLFKEDGPLHHVLREPGRGRCIPIQHEDVQAWLNGPRRKNGVDAKLSETLSGGPVPSGNGWPNPQDIDLSQLQKMTLEQIVASFGHVPEMQEYAKTLKLLLELQEKELKIAEQKGAIIPRSIVVNHVLGPLDSFLTALVTDVCRAIGTRTAPMVNSGKVSPGEIEDLCVEMISGHIKRMKTAMKSALERMGDEDGHQ